MKSNIYFPSDVLKPYIKKITIEESLLEQTYSVLPDTSLVMGFQYKGRVSIMENGEKILLCPNGITGLIDTFRVFTNTNNIASILVYFTETGAYNFFSNPINELFNKSESLDNFIKPLKIRDIGEQLYEANSDAERINIVENFLISELDLEKSDLLISSAINKINQCKGNIRISQLSKELFLSSSALEKRFRKVVGTSPKKFSKIVRIKNTIDEMRVAELYNKSFYENIYFDQAHFIKDFKVFTGLTPKQFNKELSRK